MKPIPVIARLACFRSSALALAVALACLAPSAHALRIGGAEVRSTLGQPLELVVPISADGDASFQAECVRVVRDAGTDGVPGPGMTRVEVETRGADYMVRVRTPHAVFEPAIKLVLEVGCAQRLRREFVLLIDPPIASDTGKLQSLAGAPLELPLVLGEPVVASQRGEPLRLRVPVTGRDAASLDPACVAVNTHPGGAATSLLRRDGSSTTVLISTAAAVESARIGVSVQAGCQQPVVRDYSLLLAAPALPQAQDAGVGAAAPRNRTARRPAAALSAPALAAEPKAARAPAVDSPAAPARSSASETRGQRSGGGDRLVLAEPETPLAPRAENKAAEPADRRALDEREQAINAQLEALAKEMTQLRQDLAVAQARNAELMKLQQAAAAPAEAPSYAWILAALAAAALGLGLLLAWRSRKPLDGGWDDDQAPAVGPATRLGVAHATEPMMVPTRSPLPRASVAAAARAAAAMAVAAPVLATGAAPADKATGVADGHDEAHGPGHDIQVTEFADTNQLIEDLYSDYIEASAPPVMVPVVPAPSPVVAAHPIDLDLGAGEEVSPPTKTQLAVDLDVGTQALPTQVLDDWDQELFLPARAPTSSAAAGAAGQPPLTPLDFELKFDLPPPPPEPKS